MKKTDILYVVGDGKNGDELRWSLRSLAAHAKGVGRVVVAGHIPDWLNDTNLIRLPIGDVTRANKHINILNAIIAACDAGLLRGDFQYSSDDHILLKDYNLAKMPFWTKPGRLLSCEEIRARGAEPTMYEAGLSTTKRLLDEHHLRTDLFCVHRNTWMSTVDLPRVKELLAAQNEYDAENYGVEPTCIFMAARMERAPNTPTQMICDRKIFGYDELYFEKETFLSTGDGMTDKLYAKLNEMFSAKCKFEK